MLVLTKGTAAILHEELNRINRIAVDELSSFIHTDIAIFDRGDNIFIN